MFVILILIIIDLYILMNTGKNAVENYSEAELSLAVKDGKTVWTVYGTTWCGWTTKQIQYLIKKKIPYKFIDCEKDNCDGIESFPFMESSSGEKVVGYKEV
jgi:hypothetical protein